MVCMVTVSMRPPCQPANIPIADPISIASSVDATPMTSEMRAP